jgi:hypothetical protein
MSPLVDFVVFCCHSIHIKTRQESMLPCNYEEDKNKVPMNKPCNIQNTNICNGIFHISFVKALISRDNNRQLSRRAENHFRSDSSFPGVVIPGRFAPNPVHPQSLRSCLINEGETTWGERESCRTGRGRSEATAGERDSERNDPVSQHPEMRNHFENGCRPS